MKIRVFIQNSQGIGEKDMKNKRFERGYCIVFFNELIHFSLSNYRSFINLDI